MNGAADCINAVFLEHDIDHLAGILEAFVDVAVVGAVDVDIMTELGFPKGTSATSAFRPALFGRCTGGLLFTVIPPTPSTRNTENASA